MVEGAIHKGFDQDRLNPVTLLPILGHPTQKQAVTAGSQIGAMDTRTNQKAGQPYDLREIGFADLAVPANPAIPTGQMKSRRSNAKGANDSLRTMDEVTQLTAEQGGILQGM